MSTSDRRRAQAQPSTEGVNRMCQTSYVPDRRRAQAQPSTEGVNRMCQTKSSAFELSYHCGWNVGI